jgi:hypothetical protein
MKRRQEIPLAPRQRGEGGLMKMQLFRGVEAVASHAFLLRVES